MYRAGPGWCGKSRYVAEFKIWGNEGGQRNGRVSLVSKPGVLGKLNKLKNNGSLPSALALSPRKCSAHAQSSEYCHVRKFESGTPI